MDAYQKFRGLNDCNQGLEAFSGFHFLFKEGLQIIEGKNRNHIIDESIDTSTPVCGTCWLDWRQAKHIMNFTDDCMNVKTIFTDEL
jgi:hypothetical protein